MRTHQFPYRARILAKLGADEPIELFRATDRPILPSDWNFWTRDMEAWQCWVEFHTREEYVLGGSRPIPLRQNPTDGDLRLTAAERARLGASYAED